MIFREFNSLKIHLLIILKRMVLKLKKPLKVLSTAGLATVFATSALVPVAAAEQPVEQNLEVTEYAVVKDGKILTVSVEAYGDYLVESDVEEVQAYGVDGKYFNVEDFGDFLVEYGTVEATVEALEKAGKALTEEVVDGEIIDGEIVAKDEQPEDRLNETFFYNVA